MNSKRRQFTLRLNENLLNNIERVANEKGVSTNALISFILDTEVKKVG